MTDGRQLTVGLIGAGMMAGIHLPAWRSLGARVVVYSIDGRAPELVAAASQDEPGTASAVDTLDELLERCQVVDICTPTFTHKDLILAAARAGRHIVCEKPLARTVQEAEEAVAAAETAGVKLFPAHVVRFFPEYEVMVNAVKTGTLGELAVLRFTRAGSFPGWSPWFAEDELSGGILLDQMVHDFDFARYIAGEVIKVHAQVRAKDNDATGNGAKDNDAEPVVTATAILTHASQAITHVHGEWGLSGTPFRTTFRIAGADGILEHDSEQAKAYRVAQQGGGGGVPSTESPYLAELREFAQAIETNTQPRVTARDGVEAVRIAAAAIESAATGRAVEIGGVE